MYPAHCLACGTKTPHSERVCPACRADLPRGPRRCPRCAGATDPTGQPCRACRQHPPAWEAALAPLAYREPVADWLRAYKYHGQPGLAQPLAALLEPEVASFLADLGLGQPWLVPVPLHRRRLTERGYNQAALLARAWGRWLGLPVRPGALRRVRPTAAQAELPGYQRRHNVRGAFRARRRVAGRPIVLVDDVVTSGATVGEAARALREAGASRVVVLALARAGLDGPAGD